MPNTKNINTKVNINHQRDILARMHLNHIIPMISESKARPVKSWNPEPFVVTKGRIWLFSDEKSWKRFQVPFFSFSASAWPWPMRNKHFAFFSANQCVFLDILINSIPPVTLEMLTRFNLAILLHQFPKLSTCNDFTAPSVGCSADAPPLNATSQPQSNWGGMLRDPLRLLQS